MPPRGQLAMSGHILVVTARLEGLLVSSGWGPEMLLNTGQPPHNKEVQNVTSAEVEKPCNKLER